MKAVSEDNPHDEFAVALYYEDKKLGYLPQSQNEPVNKVLKAGDDIFEVRIRQKKEDKHPERQIRIVVHVKEEE